MTKCKYSVVFGFLMALIERLSKSLVIIFNHQFLHTAKKIKVLLGFIGRERHASYFLPPYSQVLDRIDLLWHKMKYEWLPFKTFMPDEFEDALMKLMADLAQNIR